MTIEIEASFELPLGPRTRIEKRLQELAVRLGPFKRVHVRLEKQWGEHTVRGEIAVRSWTVRPDGASVHGLDDAIDKFLADLVKLLRHAVWARDGVAEPCGWCDAEEFVFVSAPSDATSEGVEQMHLIRSPDKSGALDSLVCRGCGHVEWFASDPLTIPVDAKRGTALVKVRPRTPFRSE